MSRLRSLRGGPPARRGVAAVLAAVLAVGALAHLPVTSAAFTAVTRNGGSSFAAAGTWCTTPGSATTTVQNDTMLAQDDPNGNYGGATAAVVAYTWG